MTNYSAKMQRAINQAWLCPKSDHAFAVGCVIIDAQERELATGYSRENDPKVHAEEAALAKLGDDPRLTTATLYSTLEPCSQRASRSKPCLQLIQDAGIPRVVIAWREPELLVERCIGFEGVRRS